MKIFPGLALVAAVFAFASPAAAAPDAEVAADPKKERAGCVAEATAKPASEGAGADKPAEHAVRASETDASAGDSVLGATEGAGDAKADEAHQSPQNACATT